MRTRVSRRRRSQLAVAAAALVAFVFVAAGIDKILHYQRFVLAFEGYFPGMPSLPHRLAPAIILLEAFLGVALIWPRWRRHAALGGLGVLFVFSGAFFVRYMQSADEICGCWFTLSWFEDPQRHLMSNAVLMLMCLTVLLAEIPDGSPEDDSTSHLQPRNYERTQR